MCGLHLTLSGPYLQSAVSAAKRLPKSVVGEPSPSPLVTTSTDLHANPCELCAMEGYSTHVCTRAGSKMRRPSQERVQIGGRIGVPWACSVIFCAEPGDAAPVLGFGEADGLHGQLRNVGAGDAAVLVLRDEAVVHSQEHLPLSALLNRPNHIASLTQGPTSARFPQKLSSGVLLSGMIASNHRRADGRMRFSEKVRFNRGLNL